ncbi:isopentenyl-diphosphate Delta-isomerase [Streptomonospora wellingtoniae]|uniref:Isopentenyl-diphosphate Delta-isomerase n=1 Tax=Streptomonospora wellingtoniae TaxID=3075544 RepID=A0ABU2KRY6_9ACTN|nr:isopentenyl-diphosphate Delta-isomerase [Streptomonospora sp. DSM 45055]MDT0302034.1 isopentenyl-diphosphate Delta-isomerase [Streptomonospora sp. DSM 45055]
MQEKTDATGSAESPGPAAEERVVLLDGGHRPVGTADKRLVHGPRTPLHLAFSCYVFDPEGRLLVTRRALDKAAWPGVWTNSFCGHPGPGEPLEEALHRRAREELGISLEGVTVLLPEFAYCATDASGIVENEFCPVYRAATRDTPHPEPGEVAEWVWVEWADFAEVARRAPWAVSPWAARQIPLIAEEPQQS